MIKDYEWGSHRTNPAPGNSPERIDALEKRLDVSFPTALREGYGFSDNASIFKQGQRCEIAVTGPKSEGGTYAGYFSYLEGLESIPREANGLQDWVDDVFEREILNVFPIATLGGGGWVCLNYQGDPTQANPEIWQFDQNGTSFEDCFTKVADSFDDLIDMLVSDEELRKLGFR